MSHDFAKGSDARRAKVASMTPAEKATALRNARSREFAAAQPLARPTGIRRYSVAPAVDLPTSTALLAECGASSGPGYPGSRSIEAR